MFVVAPKMDVNFPADFVIKSRSLAVESKNIPTHVAVSLPSSKSKWAGEYSLRSSLGIH